LSVEALRIALHRRMRSALVRKQSYIEVSAGDLQHEVANAVSDDEDRNGDDSDIMPICCGVLRAEMSGADQVIREAPQGRGPSLTIRFVIPRM